MNALKQPQLLASDGAKFYGSVTPDEGLFRASCFADVSLGNISRTEAPRGEVFTTLAEAQGWIDAQAAARGFDVWYLA